MVVIDEVDETLIDPLVVGHMRERRMDTDAGRDDLRQRALRLDEAVIRLAGADLVGPGSICEWWHGDRRLQVVPFEGCVSV
jgi:hypothetical protein